MAKQAKDHDWSADVTRIYGVVPRPRSSVDPSAWARTKKPGKWRAYYGYRYRPDSSPARTEGAKFSDAQVAAATIAHQERGGRVAAFEPSGDEKRAAFMAEAVASVTHATRARKAPTPRPHGVNGVDYHVGPIAPAAAPEPVREPEPVSVPEPIPAPIVAPAPSPAPAEAVACTCEHDRLAQAAETLRDLAAKYGPRRAHKLLAMADFVTAAAGIAA